MSVQLTSSEISTIQQLVNDAKSIVVTSHKSPDGDAIGSALAVYHILKKLGKEVTVVLPDDVPAFLQWLNGYRDIVIFQYHTEKAKEYIAQADLIFSLDYNNLSRVGSDMEVPLRAAKADFILIDHHQQPEPFAKVTYSDTASCSTAELVFKTIESCGWKKWIDTNTAESIYCGIMTDSGSFRFPAVTKETHTIVGELLDVGLDHARVHRKVYDNNLPNKMRLVGYALSEKLEILPDCATSYISLSTEEMERFHYQPGDTESLVNQALSIKGIKLAAFIREGKDEVRVSFRSKSSFDVNEFARNSWNGGGHKNASGGRTSETLEEAVARFRKECESMKEQIAQS